MFSAQELVEVRKMVLSAIMMTREDFLKATEDVAAGFQALEDAHKARLAKATEQYQTKIKVAQEALDEAKSQLNVREADLEKGREKLGADRVEFQASSVQMEDQLRQRRKELDEAIRQQTILEEGLRERVRVVDTREASIVESYEQINTERAAMREKEAQMRALVAVG